MYDSENMSVGEYLDRLLDAVRGTVRERTWQRNEEIVRIHLKPTLGGTKLDKLDALKVQTLYGTKLESGFSPRTVQIIHTTLHKALKQAVRWTLIPRNVTEAVDPPRPSAKEIWPLGVERVKKLLVAAKGLVVTGLGALGVIKGKEVGIAGHQVLDFIP